MKVHKWFTVVCFFVQGHCCQCCEIVVRFVAVCLLLVQMVDHQWFCVAIRLDCFFVGYCDWVVWLVLCCISFCELWFHKQHMIAFYFKRNLARAVASATLFFVVVPSFTQKLRNSRIVCVGNVLCVFDQFLSFDLVFWPNQHVMVRTVFDFIAILTVLELLSFEVICEV